LNSSGFSRGKWWVTYRINILPVPGISRANTSPISRIGATSSAPRTTSVRARSSLNRFAAGGPSGDFSFTSGFCRRKFSSLIRRTSARAPESTCLGKRFGPSVPTCKVNSNSRSRYPAHTSRTSARDMLPQAVQITSVYFSWATR